MPRQVRLDVPGTLHQVMKRGIAGTKIFRKDMDREDFLSRLGERWGRLGYPGAEVARFLGETTLAVIRAAYSEELPKLQKYL